MVPRVGMRLKDGCQCARNVPRRNELDADGQEQRQPEKQDRPPRTHAWAEQVRSPTPQQAGRKEGHVLSAREI